MSNAYYGNNSGAKLYMGASTATTLPAPGSDTFSEVPLLGTITPPPNTQSVNSFNVLNDANPRSVGGKLQARSVPGDLVIDWTESVHNSMYTDSIVAGGQKRNWRIVYPDSNNRQLDFVAMVTDWKEEAFDAGGDVKEHRATFVLSVAGTGAITVTP